MRADEKEGKEEHGGQCWTSHLHQQETGTTQEGVANPDLQPGEYGGTAIRLVWIRLN